MYNESSSSSDSAHDLDTAAPRNDEDANDSEEDDSTASASEAEGASRRRRRQRIHFGVDQLQTVYHLPLKTAAERLGICEAALKRICRRNRIRKWPYRQLSSVRRRIAELKDQQVAFSASLLEGDRVPDRHMETAVQASTGSAPEHFDTRLQQLEAEQLNIIRSAHHKRRPKKKNAGHQSTVTSWQQRPVPGEALTILLHGYERTAEESAPLDLRWIDSDFPLLFLANVCESVRALHSA
ncbi:hypothetical protein PF005_g15757 [Phytophthora fragariae]|nr:hypothetical protein PF007_g16094 [Phytophthora fragariae]KAE9199389.1 hypothetical protein PF005_g15757 [Phytophthora fragariae]KAE9215279.1 hypothetical protein PF004_g14800 [Phytophthora fragariae]KAE9215808.1 hypothetical protein PF002_g17270 [Phytophthora fragariae]KAE9292320.1 hypothetical protein PF001_g18770 [Phytophthora fragariae]